MGGDTLSKGWNEPLNREGCREEVVEDVADEVFVEGAFGTAVSREYIQFEAGPTFPTSTIMGALEPECDLPSSIFLASWAPAGDLNRRSAERKPGSSDWSSGRIWMSVSSLEKVVINRTVCSEVSNGRRRRRAKDDGEEEYWVREPPDIALSRSK